MSFGDVIENIRKKERHLKISLRTFGTKDQNSRTVMLDNKKVVQTAIIQISVIEQFVLHGIFIAERESHGISMYIVQEYEEGLQ